MAIRKKKENKLAVRPSETRSEITNTRPTDIWSEMDKLFDSFRTDFDDLLLPFANTTTPMTAIIPRRTPPMDVADLGDHYEMRLEMPGIPKDDINIHVTSNSVEISAQYEENKEEKDKNWLRRERSCSSYYRALELPEDLKTDNADAELEDGVLKLTLPKLEPRPEDKPKKIKIK